MANGISDSTTQQLARVQQLLRQGQLDPAAAALRTITANNPRLAIAQLLLGTVLGQQGRHGAAIEYLRTAVDLSPRDVHALSNLGGALYAVGDYLGAAEMSQRALRIEPDFVPALCNFAQSCLLIGRIQDAANSLERARRIEPNSPRVLSPYARLCTELGDHAGAIAAHRRAMQANPSDTAVYDQLLCAMNYGDAVTQQEMLATARRFPARVSPPPAPARPTEAIGRKLRVGYVSPDMRRHSVSYFLLPLIENHRRDHIEAICYSDTEREDEITKRFQSAADLWRKTGDLNADQLARQIRADRIDILFDVCGHWIHNRLSVFALRPAPIQIAWLGYPNTTGLATIEYRLTDAVADPPDEPQLYSETLVRLPAPFLCYSPILPTPDVSPAPAEQNGTLTFGSFNNLAKLSDKTIALWGRVLTAAPNSRLLLKSGGTGDAMVRQRHERRFAALGLDPARVAWHAWRGTTAHHLATYAEVDVALDPLPYNGTTTTCEALWMGVPVVTLRGDRHAARVGATILSSIGCTEWIAETPDQYVDIAQRLAADRGSLARIRGTLRERMRTSPLCDGPGFARRFEALLQDIWAGHSAAQQTL